MTCLTCFKPVDAVSESTGEGFTAPATVEQDNHEDGFAKDVKVRALFCRLVRICSAPHGMARETRVYKKDAP